MLCLCASLRKLDFATVTKSDRENAALLPKLNPCLLERFAPATPPEIEKNNGLEIPANPLAANAARNPHATTAGGGGAGAGGGGATPTPATSTPSTATPTVTLMTPSALITAAAVGAGGGPRAGSRMGVDREGKEDGQEEEEEDIAREIWGDSLPFRSCTSNARETMN